MATKEFVFNLDDARIRLLGCIKESLYLKEKSYQAISLLADGSDEDEEDTDAILDCFAKIGESMCRILGRYV